MNYDFTSVQPGKMIPLQSSGPRLRAVDSAFEWESSLEWSFYIKQITKSSFIRKLWWVLNVMFGNMALGP